MFAGLPAEMAPTYLPLLFSTSITRYVRPKTTWNRFEKLIFPEIVGSLWKCRNCVASVDPLVDPCARLIAVASASIAVAPVTKLPVAGAAPRFFIAVSSFRTAGFGSSPKIDAKLTNQYFVTFGLFGHQLVPSPPQELRIGVFTRRLRSPETSGPGSKAFAVTITCAPRTERILLTTFGVWFWNDLKCSAATILPPSALYRTVNALTTSWK